MEVYVDCSTRPFQTDFFAASPPSPVPIRKVEYWRCEVFLFPLSVDTGAQDLLLQQQGYHPLTSMAHPDSFVPYFVQAALVKSFTHPLFQLRDPRTPGPPRINEHLSAESFLSCSPYTYMMGWEAFSIRSISIEGTFLFSPGCCALYLCQPQAQGLQHQQQLVR